MFEFLAKKSRMTMLAAVLVSVIGVLFYNVMPIYLGALQDSSGLRTEQIGFVASAFFFGFILSSASAFFWVRRIKISPVVLMLSAVLAVVFYLGTQLSNAFPLYALSIVIGAVSGAMAAIAATLIGESSDAKFWYGVKVALESLAGVSLLFVLPMTLIPEFGFYGVVIGMVAIMALFVPFLFFLQRTSLEEAAPESASGLAEQDTQTTTDRFAIGMGILTMFLFFAGGAAVWAFAERIANAYGFDGEKVGMILSVALFFAVIGPLITGPLSARIGVRTPFLVSAISMAIGVFLMSGSEGALSSYAIGASVFMLGFGGGNPLIFSKIAANDATGKFVTLSITSLGVGSMVGPAVAGMILANNVGGLLQWFVIGSLLLSAVCMWFSGGED